MSEEELEEQHPMLTDEKVVIFSHPGKLEEPERQRLESVLQAYFDESKVLLLCDGITYQGVAPT